MNQTWLNNTFVNGDFQGSTSFLSSLNRTQAGTNVDRAHSYAYDQ